MPKRIRPYAYLLVLPVVALLFIAFVQKALYLDAANPGSAPRSVAEFIFTNAAVDNFCAVNALSVHVCGTTAALTLARYVAFVSIAVVIATLLGIRYAGLRARRDPALLAKLFRPCLYLSVFLVAAIEASWLALMAGAWFGLIKIVSSVILGLVIMFSAMGSLVAVLVALWCIPIMLRPATVTVLGRVVGRKEAPDLYERVDYAAWQLGAERPDNIVFGIDLYYFMTAARVNCIGAKLKERTLYCSMPLSRVLDDKELDSILYRALTYFQPENIKLSTNVFPAYRGVE